MFGKIFKRLNNKYFYAFIVFLIWIFFFDNNNLISRYKMRKSLKQAKMQKEFYKKEIARDSQTIDGLLHDSSELERFGREQYLMKKDDEDIFLIVKKEPGEK